VPKTIGNDLMFMDRSFGYQTAFAAACHAVTVAHTEARGSRNGVRLVKLMGRDSGFIACSAALAAGKTGMVVARWHQRFVHLPMSLVTRSRRKVDPNGDLWRSVLELTGQPAKMGI
jgi:6-phosphofructokinase 1